MLRTQLLKGVATITGAGSGIGQATAVGLIRHGVRKIAICDLSRQGMNDTIALMKDIEKNVEIEAIEMDVTKESAVSSGFRAIVDRFGRIDHAINNAGIVAPLEGSAGTSLEGWEKCFAVNSTVSLSAYQRETNKQLTLS
jgi:NAD(P)-dependent dehydrogenase (short-subunit alcohol dehydrogenase family)